MRKKTLFIPHLFLLSVIICACNLTKRVPDGKHLLLENKIEINNKKSSDSKVIGQIYQQPNSNIAGIPLALIIYNTANAQPRENYDQWLERNPNTKQFLTNLLSAKQTDRLGDSFFVSGISNMMKSFGETPVIFDIERANRSEIRLKNYFFNQGYFNTIVSKEVDTTELKKAKVTYKVQTGSPYLLDSISVNISSPDLHKVYEEQNKFSLLYKNDRYNAATLDKERDRITAFFRNHGVFDFQKSFINFEIDTLKQNNTADIVVRVEDKTIKSANSDTLVKEPFKVYTIGEVNIYTANPQKVKNLENTTYKDVTIYSDGPLNYKKKTLADASFINKGDVYSDWNRALTIKSFSSHLNVFNYPTIEFLPNKKDTLQNSLIANIYVTPRKRASFNPTVDVTHSNIQRVGIEGTMGMSFRNIFKGSETLDVNFRGNIGSSTSQKFRSTDRFFNILEYGVDVKLRIPKLWFFTDTDILIPKQMFPTTNFSVGIANQQNIGLDKQNFSSIFNYNWNPRNRNNLSLDVFNVQFVKNTNPGNYFNVYRTSYYTLNNIASGYPELSDHYFNEMGNLTIEEGGVDAFINDVLNNQTPITTADPNYRQIASIAERRKRLTENNLILSTNLTFTTSTRSNIQDNEFYNLKTKIETAGNIFSLMNLKSREDGKRTFLDVAYSQYVKTEIEYVKYFDLGNKNILALRTFGGIAIPYGNSTNIPFSRSYFAGGSNDNRAWQSYRLGPGSSGGINDFNEANMKLAFNLEYRFNVSGPWNLALFADAGNIWNALDDTESNDMKFTSWKSLKDLALGTGLGLRYDLSFFVIRVDVGLKTYNPDKNIEKQWFSQWNLNDAVLNVGVNYPF